MAQSNLLLKKYSCINDIVVLYNEITPNAYVVTVYVIPVSSSKGFEDCNRDYPKIKNDIIELADSMGIHIHIISQASRS